MAGFFSRTSSAFAWVAFFAVAVAGCAYDGHQAPLTNGAEGQLYFSWTGSSGGKIPVGVTRTISVVRSPGGTVDCHPLGIKSESSLTIQGGGHPDLPRDTCDRIGDDEVEFQSAQCDDDACSIDFEARGREVLLRVRSNTPGQTQLHVSLKSTKDGGIHDDHIPISFAKAARFKLAKQRNTLRLPLVTETVIKLPRATVVDEHDEPMSVDDDSIVRTIGGDAVLEETDDQFYSDHFTARSAGHATVHWQLADVLARDLDVEFVSPSDVAAIVVDSELPEDPPAEDFDAPAPASLPAPASSVAVEVFDYSGKAFATHVVLKDGRRALSPLDAVTVLPETLTMKARPCLGDLSTVCLGDPSVVGSGTLTVRAAHTDVTSTIPLTITMPTQQDE